MAEIRFYNTLTHQLEPFTSIEPGRVSMYNCGPTVYDFAHIGNFRAFVFADVLRRLLELNGYEVEQVMNITDVGHMTEDQVADGGGEDKMQVATRRIKEAKKQGTLPAGTVDSPDDPYQIAEYFTRAFIDDARSLRLKIADEYPDRMPRATQHVGKMMKLILQLVERGHAYVVRGKDGQGDAVYFSVESFSDYGKLSGNTLDKLRGGAGGRVAAEHQAGKRHPGDFLLWKADPTHLMRWESPWGEGYPGWHIECSAMAMEVLGRDVIDIHTGGEDNIFPHHECEIAQTRGVTGKDHFARFWMHTRFLLVEGEKMSKSRGNFYTVRDVLEGKVTGRPVDPAVLRFELLKSHYRSNMNFTVKGLEDSGSAVRKLREAAKQLEARAGDAGAGAVDREHPALVEFTRTLGDDLNMAGALGIVFDFIHSEHGDASRDLMALREMDKVLGVLEPGVQSTDDDAAAKARQIDEARRARDFATADRLRQALTDAGYEVQTTKEGTVATRRLA